MERLLRTTSDVIPLSQNLPEVLLLETTGFHQMVEYMCRSRFADRVATFFKLQYRSCEGIRSLRAER
jgi:hypothetical protein